MGNAHAQETEEGVQQVFIQCCVERVEQRIENEERVRYLQGNVRLLQDSTYLQSDRAVQYLDRDEIFFFDNVLIADQGDSLRADTVFYNRRSKVGEALGRVELSDGEVRVFAPAALHFTDEKRTDFMQGVTLVDTTSTLTSLAGTYYSDESRADFAGLVQLTSDDTFLQADAVRFYREEEISHAYGRVLIERFERDEGQEETPADSLTRTYLLGDYAYNDDKQQRSRVEGRALVYQLRYEDDQLDTLMLRADWLYTQEKEGHRQIIGRGEVQSWQADFAAVADSAVYDRYQPGYFPVPGDAPPDADTLEALLADASPEAIRTGAPAATAADTAPDTTTSADAAASRSSAATAADTTAAGRAEQEPPPAGASPLPLTPLSPDRGHEAEEPLEEARLFRDPVGWFEESQMSADTIRVRSGGGAPVDSIFGRGHVFLAQLDSTTQRIHQLRGRQLEGISTPDSMRAFDVWPNAAAVYHRHTEAGAPDGALRVRADASFFRFEGDELKYIHFAPNIEGQYWEEELVPDPLELDGFLWLPELRPTQAALLNAVPEQRVQLFMYLAGKLLPDRPPPPHHWLRRGVLDGTPLPELPDDMPLAPPGEVPLPRPDAPPSNPPPSNPPPNDAPPDTDAP
jgi:lipopolysaccharide export system protein LptA